MIENTCEEFRLLQDVLQQQGPKYVFVLPVMDADEGLSYTSQTQTVQLCMPLERDGEGLPRCTSRCTNVQIKSAQKIH